MAAQSAIGKNQNIKAIEALVPESGKVIGWNNSGAPVNLPLFNPAIPGAIGSTTPSTGKFTELIYSPTSVRIRSDGNFNFVNGNSNLVAGSNYYNFFQGWQTGLNFTTGSHNFLLGNLAGQNLQTGNSNFFAGSYAGYSLVNSDNNFLLGYAAGYNATTLSKSMILGNLAGNSLISGANSSFLGVLAGYETQVANNSLFLGYGAGYKQINSESNLYIGSLCSFSNTSGNFNTIIGGYAWYDSLSGSRNTAVGYQALRSTTGLSGCVALGNNSGTGETESNRLHLANSATKSLIYGQFDNDNVGINTKNFAGTKGSLAIKNRSQSPTGTPTDGGILSIDSGKPKYTGTGITDRDIALNPMVDPLGLMTYTLGTLPSASTHANRIVAVSDSTEGSIAVSNGTNWIVFASPNTPPVRSGRRLTLTSGIPVTSTGTTSSNIFYTAFEHDGVPMWDGSRWRLWRGGELSLPLSGLVANTNYAVFCHWNSGSPILQLDPWFDNTRRRALINPTPQLVRQDGIMVSQTNSALHIGDIRTISATQTIDNLSQCFISNVYNRVRRNLKKFESAVSWNPLSTGVAPWGNRSGATTAGLANRLEWISCDNSNSVTATFNPRAILPSGVSLAVGIGLDSITAVSLPYSLASSITVTNTYPITVEENPGMGYHFLQTLTSASALTVSLSGNGECGIIGSIFY